MAIEVEGGTLEEVFIANRAPLRRIAQRIVGSPEIADEVTQDAYVKLVTGGFDRAIEKPYCYCCQVVRNVARDYCRRQSAESIYRIHTSDGELPQVSGGCRPEQRLRERQVIDALGRVLDTLPAKTRHAFELYRLGGFTQRELAAEMGCSATLINFMIRDATLAIAGCREMMDD